MTDFAQFIDRVGGTPGTALDAAHLNALAKAQPYLLTGGVLPTGGSLTQTMPATEAVINTGSTQVYVKAASQAFTCGASKDVYFDLDTAGVWHKVEVANGASAPVLTANCIRASRAVTSGSAVTAATKIAPGGPLPAIVLAAYRVSLNGGESNYLAGPGTWYPVGDANNLPGFNAARVTLPVRSGSLVRVSLFGQWDGNPGPYPGYVKLRTNIDGTAGTREWMFRPNSDNTVRIAFRTTITGLAAGVHTITLEGITDLNSFGYNDANGTSGGEFIVEEIGPNP